MKIEDTVIYRVGKVYMHDCYYVRVEKNETNKISEQNVIFQAYYENHDKFLESFERFSDSIQDSFLYCEEVSESDIEELFEDDDGKSFPLNIVVKENDDHNSIVFYKLDVVD